MGEYMEGEWANIANLQRKSFTCGFCGVLVGSEKGFSFRDRASGRFTEFQYICPNCNFPTFFVAGFQIPGSLMGNSVGHLPKDLNDLYEEARKCTSQNCYTAAVLLCRKILMNVAVNLGANENQKFIDYVNFISDKGYVPPQGKHWVDHIRKKGNEANHEIQLMDKNDAKELLIFTEMLLKFNYEFPEMVPKP
jgi:hypothetical protein